MNYFVVEADTGIIGGKFSHEFIVSADNGEEVVVYCEDCGYAAKYEMSLFKNSEIKKTLKQVLL